MGCINENIHFNNGTDIIMPLGTLIQELFFLKFEEKKYKEIDLQKSYNL